MTHRLFSLWILALSASAAPITINYDARLINDTQTGLNLHNPSVEFAVQDFLTQFGLQTVAGPTGTELPFSGTYTFDFPQAPQPGTGAFFGGYEISNFTINGISLVPNPPVFLNESIGIALNPTGCVCDEYYIQLNDDPPPSSDGMLRSLALTLIVLLPRGTFSSPALPPDVNFFPLVTGTGGGIIYDVQSPGGPIKQFSNNARWLSASVSASDTPEPGTLALVLGGLLCVALASRRGRQAPD